MGTERRAGTRSRGFRHCRRRARPLRYHGRESIFPIPGLPVRAFHAKA